MRHLLRAKQIPVFTDMSRCRGSEKRNSEFQKGAANGYEPNAESHILLQVSYIYKEL
jgi:hypothetical protein